MLPLECGLQVPIALSGPRFGVEKRGEVPQKRLETLPARFPSEMVSRAERHPVGIDKK